MFIYKDCMCSVVTFTSLDLDSENIWETLGNKARGSKREMQMRQLDMFALLIPTAS